MSVNRGGGVNRLSLNKLGVIFLKGEKEADYSEM